MRTHGDGKGLPMGFGGEGGRADVGHPNLDRTKSLLAQPLTMGTDLPSGRNRACAGHSELRWLHVTWHLYGRERRPSHLPRGHSAWPGPPSSSADARHRRITVHHRRGFGASSPGFWHVIVGMMHKGRVMVGAPPIDFGNAPADPPPRSGGGGPCEAWWKGARPASPLHRLRRSPSPVSRGRIVLNPNRP